MSTRISRSVSRFTSVRHRTAYRIGLIVVCAVVWTCSTALTSTAAPRTTLMVRVYQTARLPSMLQQRALAEAELVLRSALVDVQWRQCTSTSADRSEACSTPPAPLELVLVVRDERRCKDTPTTLGKARDRSRHGRYSGNCVLQLRRAVCDVGRNRRCGAARSRGSPRVGTLDAEQLGARAPWADAPALDAGRSSTESRGGLGVHGGRRCCHARAAGGAVEHAACWRSMTCT